MACGQLTTSQHAVLRCEICAKQLCKSCHKIGLCPNHYRLLTPEERKILSLIYNTKIYGGFFELLSCFPILFGIFFIFIGIITDNPIGTGIALLILGLSVTLGITILNKRNEKKRIPVMAAFHKRLSHF